MFSLKSFKSFKRNFMRYFIEMLQFKGLILRFLEDEILLLGHVEGSVEA